MSNSRDTESFSAYYRKAEASSKRMLRKLLSGTPADWQDIHDGVWCKFAEKYFDPAFEFRAGLDAYLNQCIFNAAMDYLRQYVTTEQPVEFDEQTLAPADPSQSVIDQDVDRLDGSAGRADTIDIEYDLKDPASWTNRDLANAVAALPRQQRAVILFWAWKEPPPTDSEIAEEFDIKRNTAKTHRTRGLTRLRRVLSVHETKKKEDSK